MDNSTFETIWHEARYNGFFWATHGVGVCSIVLLFACSLKGRLMAHQSLAGRLLMTGMFLAVTAFTIAGVGRKWNIRFEAAQTEEQRMAVANRDGANLGVSPIIGVFWASCYAMACMAASRFGYGCAGRTAPKEHIEEIGSSTS